MPSFGLSVTVALASFCGAGCYLTHSRPGEDAPDPEPRARDRGSSAPMIRRDGDTRLPIPEREKIERPTLPPIQCTAEPAPDCVASFPRVMIVMDASSSMLAGRRLGANNWDKARFALAGNPDADVDDEDYVQPAFERELDVRGNLVTMQDVFHLGLIVFNAADTQQRVLQFTPCATDNIAWAMDPYTSCEPPGCVDPYVGQPRWTFKNSDVDREPPFVETTYSFMPPCNEDSACTGRMYNTFTAEGLDYARQNIAEYRRDPGRFDLDQNTRFANILITDGETAPESPPEAVLEKLAAEGVPTYVIGLLTTGLARDVEHTLGVLDGYALAGGTRLATLIPPDESDIADAFAETVTRIIDEVGTDPCCQPTHCSEDPEP